MKQHVAQLKKDTASVNNTQLYYERQGNGQTIIMLHGMALDRRSWDQQFNTFALKFDVVRYDARGYGLSALPDGHEFSHAEDLQGLIKALNIKKPVLLGASMGAQTSLEYALRYPDDAAALILISPILLAWTFSDDALVYFTHVVKTARKDGLDKAKKIMLDSKLLRHTSTSPNAGHILETMINDYSGFHLLHDSPNKQLHPPMVEQLKNINMPILALAGDQEWSETREILNLISKNIPHADARIIKGAGHLINIEDPILFHTLFSDFVKEHQLT